MRAAFYTLGCKVNQYETAALEQQFAGEGFTLVPHTAQADVYVLNSCTVTANGDKKSRQMLHRFRRQSPGAVLALCGCFPQAFPDEARGVAEADIVVGSTDRSSLLGLVLDRLRQRGAAPAVRIAPHRAGEAYEPLRVARFTSRTRAAVKIQDGCSRRCSYCIIPTARGPGRSRPLAELRDELAALSGAGHREVVLVGVNLASYGAECGLRLTDAVEAACATPGIRRVRLGSLEPDLLTGADIAALAKLPQLCPQFHVSLQSGCDETLRRMNRRYDTAGYRAVVRGLRAAFPGCAVTTDVMVGFPGETRDEFDASMAFVREIAFAKAHVFAYSKRPGTPAADMPGQVDEAEKARRARLMGEAADGDRRAFLAAQVGGAAGVLLQTRGEDGLWNGYTPNYTPVRLYAPHARSGDILAVRITGSDGRRCTAVPAEDRPDGGSL